MNHQKFNDCLTAYIDHCQASTWVKEESYKFLFANWLYARVNLLQKSQVVLSLCKEALKENYALEGEKVIRGVQFLQLAARVSPSNAISLDDVEIFKYLATNDVEDEAIFKKRGMSFPALSGWLGTLSPKKFMPVVTTDFVATIEWLFDLSKFPSEGYRFLNEASTYLKITKDFLRERSLPNNYLDRINRFIKEKELGQQKPRYTEVDWNWAAQDFHLFVHREVLKLRVKEESRVKNISQRDNGTISSPSDENPEESLIPKRFPVLELYSPPPFPYPENPPYDPTAIRHITFSEQDYLEKYQNQLRRGSRCEQIAFISEVEHLQACDLHELASNVQIVSANPSVGYDIQSYEQDGTEKQIEVKSISGSDPKSFFISSHELEKCATLENYYIYCISEREGVEPIIYRLKTPDLLGSNQYSVNEVNYKISFT